MTHPIWPGGPDCGCGQAPYTTYHMGWAAAVEAERARYDAVRGALVTVAQWDSWASEWLAKHPLEIAAHEEARP